MYKNELYNCIKIYIVPYTHHIYFFSNKKRIIIQESSNYKNKSQELVAWKVGNQLHLASAKTFFDLLICVAVSSISIATGISMMYEMYILSVT